MHAAIVKFFSNINFNFFSGFSLNFYKLIFKDDIFKLGKKFL